MTAASAAPHGAYLGDRLASFQEGDPTDDELLDTFLGYAKDRGLELYPAQEEAILEVLSGANVILNTPTGSGKSLVATAAHFFTAARGGRAFYTCPIKALANEKFFALARDFGPDRVGLLTGDAQVNPGADVICCTQEVLMNLALREGKNADVAHVVVDEFHYYADKERGVAWQVPLLELPQATFLLMSATLGDATPFENALTARTGKPTKVVRGKDRPVPLTFTYSEDPLHEALPNLFRKGRAPVYIVSFTRSQAAEEAQNLTSLDLSTKEEKKAIAEALVGVKFTSPYGKDMQRFIRHGIGLHHAGLLPKYRLLVEKLAQRGLLKVVSGTDTLGVGVNIPIRTVLLTRLCKYDGEKTAILSARDFHQISGRAGRKGFDDEGFVVAQAPEHVIENLRLEAKANGDPKKLRKLVRKKPPDRGYVPWDKKTFEGLIVKEPEPLTSRFSISHGMVLELLEREEEGGCLGIGRLIKRSHERPAEKKIHAKQAQALVRSLAEAGIVEWARDDDGTRRVRVSSTLQEDFSLHQTLSLYLLETLPLLDPETETYALDVLTLVEAILENPDAVLQRQLDELRNAKFAEMKAAGVEYDERIAELEKLEYPKPHREFIYDTWNAFARKHPWVGQENIRPKSIARDMYEKYLSFFDYVKEYGLARNEGILLRYLSDVVKTLIQTVPDRFKNDEVRELEDFFFAMVRAADSSLLDEWERMRDPDAGPREAPQDDGSLEPEGTRDITRDVRAFTVLVRNAMFDVVRKLARRDYEAAAAVFETNLEFSSRTIETSLVPYFEEHGLIDSGPEARSPKQLTIDKEADPSGYAWSVTQVLLDADGPTPWTIEATVDLEASRIEGRAVLRFKRVGN